MDDGERGPRGAVGGRVLTDQHRSDDGERVQGNHRTIDPQHSLEQPGSASFAAAQPSHEPGGIRDDISTWRILLAGALDASQTAYSAGASTPSCGNSPVSGEPATAKS